MGTHGTIVNDMVLSVITAVEKGYWDCALWSSTDDDGESLSEDHDVYDVCESATRDARNEIFDFLAMVAEHRVDIWASIVQTDPTRFGHDFWLTRNGHGAGFWDRGYGERGDWLTKMSKPYGSVDLWVHDETGKIHTN